MDMEEMLAFIQAHYASGASHSGRVVALSDAANARLQSLKIYGKTIPASKYRVTVYDANMQQVGESVETTNTYYTVTGLTNGNRYYINVESYVNGEWYGTGENIISDIPFAPPEETAAYYPVVNCTTLDGGTYLEWDAVESATKYYIGERVGTTGADWIDIESAYHGTSYYIPQQNDAEYHRYAVQAYVDKWYPKGTNSILYSSPRRNGAYSPYISATHGDGSIALTWAASIGELIGKLYITVGGSLMTIPLAAPLRGVPVLDNGTYIDASGQAWTADEIDFAHGKIIRRIDTDGTILVTPTETPLTDEQIAAWRSCRTTEGTCGIYNSEAAYMDISYLRSTGNGRALAAVQDDLQAQIDALTDNNDGEADYGDSDDNGGGGGEP